MMYGNETRAQCESSAKQAPIMGAGQMAIRGGAPDEPQPIAQAMDRLSCAIAELDSRIDLLQSRITPVLASVPETLGGNQLVGASVSRGNSQLIQGLGTFADRIDELIRRVGYISSRVEL